MFIKKTRGKLYVAFFDFKTAYDSIQSSSLGDVLLLCNIKGNLLKSFRSMYEQVLACVRLKGTLSDYFNCPAGLKQGCIASPLLFSFFINDLANEINNSDIKGVQLFPDQVEILILLFADDVALCSETVCRLQRQLNILSKYCDESKLKVNSQKTKIMVFKNGGRLSRNERWTFNGHETCVVNHFSYVGVTFSSKLSINTMANEQALKAKRAFISILNS